MEAPEQFVTDMFGPRCETKDTDDFPDGETRCATCEMWELLDQWRET